MTTKPFLNEQKIKWILIAAGLLTGMIISTVLIFNFYSFQETGLIFSKGAWLKAYSEMKPEQYQLLKKDLEKNNPLLEKKLNKNLPSDPYLIVNTSTNTFRLMKSGSLLREGICSTGSYTLLKAGNEQQWIFKTPRGIFRIQNKIEAPVWRKPDWAFVEEGLPVPPAEHPDRYEYGVLGDYAMSIGHGYLIHGTLYKRFLGMPVTHGCIRLGDEDLEAVFKNMRTGGKVFIY